MTNRLYYHDSYQVQFSARVIERLEWEDQPAVVLDQTVFYPTGGGQFRQFKWTLHTRYQTK